MSQHIGKSDCRIDYNSAGDLDDIHIKDVTDFRMERMSDNSFWLRLYRDGKEDVIFWLNSEKPIKGTHEFD
jgi:hypothetical protein